MLPLWRSAYRHITIIKNKPHEIKRFTREDKWVAGHHYKNIKTFQQLMINKETFKHKTPIIITKQEENEMARLQAQDNPLYSLWQNMTRRQKYVDDYQLTQDISKMTLWGFIKETISFKKEIHKLFWLQIILILESIFVYLFFMYGKELKIMEMAVPVNPESIDNYCLGNVEKNVKKFQDQIRMIEIEYYTRLREGIELDRKTA